MAILTHRPVAEGDERPAVALTPVTVANQTTGDVRERIAVAALDLFAAQGFAATSMRAVSARAGTTKPMVYYYFDSKEGLYRAMLHRQMAEFARVIATAAACQADPIEQLRRFADAYLGFVQAHEPHIAFMLREIFGLGGAMVQALGRDKARRGSYWSWRRDSFRSGPCPASPPRSPLPG